MKQHHRRRKSRHRATEWRKPGVIAPGLLLSWFSILVHRFLNRLHFKLKFKSVHLASLENLMYLVIAESLHFKDAVRVELDQSTVPGDVKRLRIGKEICGFSYVYAFLLDFIVWAV